VKRLIGLLLVCAGCMHSIPGTNSLTIRPIPGRALSGTEGQSIIVTPVLYIRTNDPPLNWGRTIDRPRDYMRHTDSLIETALTQRAPHAHWVFADVIDKQRLRNPGYIADPHALSGAQLLPAVYRPGTPIQEPLAGELRTLVDFQETARYVLIPVEIHFTNGVNPDPKAPPPSLPPPGTPVIAQAVLRVVLYDARATVVLWQGDVVGDPVKSPDGAMESLARYLGDRLGAP
jgi:hypothetical protein